MNTRVATAGALLLHCLSCGCGAYRLHSFDLRTKGKLVLRVPVMWSSRVEQAPDWAGGKDAPPMIVLQAPPGTRCAVSLNVSLLAARTASELHLYETREAARVVEKGESVERSLDVRALGHGPNVGYGFSYTDARPGVKFKYITRGTVLVDDLMVYFSVEAIGSQMAELATVFDMLSTARHSR